MTVALHLKLQAKGISSDYISLLLARDKILNVVTLVFPKSSGTYTYSFNLFWDGEDWFEVYFRPVACIAILFVCLCMP